MWGWAKPPLPTQPPGRCGPRRRHGGGEEATAGDENRRPSMVRNRALICHSRHPLLRSGPPRRPYITPLNNIEAHYAW